MNELWVVLPVTLFEHLPKVHQGRKVVILEHPVYFGDIGGILFDFSKPKLAYTKATMLAYSAYLVTADVQHEYIELKDYLKYRKELRHYDIIIWDPADRTVVDDLENASKSLKVLDAPNFLTSEVDLKWYAENKPGFKYFHKHFYEWQRKRTRILMKNNKPIGGKFSYDAANRRPLPKRHHAPLPSPLTKEDHQYWQSASAWVEKTFSKAPGSLEQNSLRFPVTYKGSRLWLDEFLSVRLSLFGLYEDAMAKDQPLLYHSGCSPMLLVGLLTPQEILARVLDQYDRLKAPVEAVEGFVRQLYWREYCLLIYRYESDKLFKSNFLQSGRKLKKCWYDGSTGIQPVDDAIKDAFKDGYLHHIRRLMQVGNLMLLTGVHPQGIFKWFLEFAVDSNVMIMTFNTLDMIGFASGGLTTTKPYCSGANYIEKMSDYTHGPWSDVWNSLYYEFWRKHYTKLKFVRQAQFAKANLDRKSPEQVNEMQQIAKTFINKTTTKR